MRTGLLDCMTGPYQGNVLPADVPWGADNGRFAKDGPRGDWIGHGAWYEWLAGQVDRHGATSCRFAVAPDIPFSAAGTLTESLPWLAKIRDLGIPAAFAAQNGCNLLGVPWDDLDVLFLAGGPAYPGAPEWKTGEVALHLTWEAHERGKWVHMGRVNSRKRLTIARSFGCDSVDGTYLAFGPDINLMRLRGWLDAADERPMLTEFDRRRAFAAADTTETKD
jgi:hypothetical protein